MSDHCPACRVARELTEHVTESGTPHPKRGAFNFARILAERACPEYQPTEEGA